jgi:hypothetical protein
MSKAENMTTDEFDPTEYKVAEVVEHIEAHPDEAARILEAEQAGKARKGVLEHGGTEGPTDYLGRTVSGDQDQLGRETEGDVDYLGRAIAG